MRFAAAPNGSFVWTRDVDGTYLVGQLRGGWEYDASAEAATADVRHIRPVAWAPKRLLGSEVPGGVVRAFSRRGSSFDRIRDSHAALFTQLLYADLVGLEPPNVSWASSDVLQSLLDPIDVEDLVFVYLQADRGLLVLPASRRADTAAYEYELIDRETGDLAIVQVKAGSSSVDLAALASAASSHGRAFAYSTSDAYTGSGEAVERLTEAALLEFVEANPHLLPPRVRRWFSRVTAPGSQRADTAPEHDSGEAREHPVGGPRSALTERQRRDEVEDVLLDAVQKHGGVVLVEDPNGNWVPVGGERSREEHDRPS